ncbi:hypothetical protein KKD62_02140 [Patescibacteria group bacterium]|nr:hypothetical protein [Patescibacteria group bacterium]MBU1931196.1 hypothetical protein [Patescibacteria group bacterium]
MKKLILLAYIVVSLIFYHKFWGELLVDNTQTGKRFGEVFAVEWGMKQVAQNISEGKNPFSPTNTILYPFGVNLTATDTGNGFFYFLLKPWLSVHQTFAILTVGGVIFANLGMYFLLRCLKVDELTSFLIGLSYGYMTFLMLRMGHWTYINVYMFPWFYYSFFSLIKIKKPLVKLIAAISLAIFFSLTLYLNLYYFIILIISIGLLTTYALIFKQKLAKETIQANWRYLALSFLLIVLFLYPWAKTLYQSSLFEDLPKVEGWAGAIQFSSDLLGFFIPTTYSYFLKPIANFMEKHLEFSRGRFENSTYVGIIIISTYATLLWLSVKKKLPKKMVLRLTPYLLTTLVFLTLTLGPFLHIAGRWGLNVGDGIRLVFPLPYAFFHYLPFMSNIRVPGRLIVGTTFFSCIVTAYLIDHLLKNKSKKFKIGFSIIFLVVFFLDQYFIVPTPPQHFFPNQAYEKIRNDSAQITVMEAPSTIRDGFVYLGKGNNINFFAGQMTHGKPVLAGYFGRIAFYKRNYYQQNPFWGYVGRLMDPDVAHNGNIDQADLINWQEIDIDKSLEAIDFLDLKYFLLNDTEPYAATLSNVLKDLGFIQTIQDGIFSLWERVPNSQEFLSIEFSSSNDVILLGRGWSTPEEDFRWSWKKSSIMFKLNQPRKLDLNFRAAAFYKAQTVAIYVNHKKVTSFTLSPDMKTYKIPIDQKFNSGINFVHFIFDQEYQMSQVIPNSEDRRKFAAKFYQAYLEENIHD